MSWRTRGRWSTRTTSGPKATSKIGQHWIHRGRETGWRDLTHEVRLERVGKKRTCNGKRARCTGTAREDWGAALQREQRESRERECMHTCEVGVFVREVVKVGGVINGLDVRIIGRRHAPMARRKKGWVRGPAPGGQLRCSLHIVIQRKSINAKKHEVRLKPSPCMYILFVLTTRTHCLPPHT